MAGRKSRYQLVLSVLLLPVGGGEDDIDIGAGVLGLGDGGVHGPGHGGGVVSVADRWSSLACVPLVFYTYCVSNNT